MAEAYIKRVDELKAEIVELREEFLADLSAIDEMYEENVNDLVVKNTKLREQVTKLREALEGVTGWIKTADVMFDDTDGGVISLEMTEAAGELPTEVAAARAALADTEPQATEAGGG